MNATRLRWLRVSVFLLALVPFVRLFVLGYQDQLGANPVEFVTRSTGTWTLVFICLSLAVTPLRRLSGWTWLIRLRRMLGLYAFFYGMVHLTTYVWFDQWFDWAEMIRDVIKRPFIAAGLVSVLLMVPLALTSNSFSMRKLGKKWQSLHRLVYPVAIAGIVHFWWHKGGKNDFFEPVIYGAVILLLLGLRIYWSRQSRQALAARQAAVQAQGGAAATVSSLGSSSGGSSAGSSSAPQSRAYETTPTLGPDYSQRPALAKKSH